MNARCSRANPDWVPASRPSQFRPVDNLIPPGPVEGKAQEAVQADFERATAVRRSDNLALEGDREFATTTSKEYRAVSATSAGKAKAVRRRTWTKQGRTMFSQFGKLISFCTEHHFRGHAQMTSAKISGF